ncbi:MAG TPA: hypothetical protein VHE83_13005 [Mycobacteriales bacterium]|nr:hypothetical protein [Mycobacteriales bacterium]
MTRFEDRLTDLLRDASDGVDVSPSLTRTVLADARRAQRKTVVLGAGAGLLGTGVVAAGAFALAAPTHQKLEVATPGAAAGTSSGPVVGPTASANGIDCGPAPTAKAPGADARAPRGKLGPAAPVKPAGLDAISLPDPAPGFPVRRDKDSSFVQSGGDGTEKLEWTRFFAVEQSPVHTQQLGCGSYESSPTGPEATIMVMSRADVPPSDGRTFEGTIAVDGTTTALGHTAYIGHDKGSDDGWVAVQASNDKWTVIASGDSGTTVDQLVTLIDAIEGI